MNGTPYYTNSSHLPVGYTEDIFSALDIQDDLQTLYTSGTVFHAFLGEKLPSWKSAADLVRKIAENHKLPYYTISPTYSICKDHGYIPGEHFTCPECGEKAEVYSRITGYYRPVQNWNDGKVQEYKDRVTYDVMNKTEVHTHAAEEVCSEECDDASPLLDGDTNLLFATKTCPNCKVAAALLDKAGIKYSKVYVEDNPDLAKELGLKQAPTLVVKRAGDTEKIVNVSNIKKYIEA
jgi:ribonucleoside-triphosphate reductase